MPDGPGERRIAIPGKKAIVNLAQDRVVGIVSRDRCSIDRRAAVAVVKALFRRRSGRAAGSCVRKRSKQANHLPLTPPKSVLRRPCACPPRSCRRRNVQAAGGNYSHLQKLYGISFVLPLHARRQCRRYSPTSEAPLDLIERIDHLLQNTMTAVKAAAEHCDVPGLQELTRRSQDLKTLKDRALALEQELRVLESESAGGLDGERNGTASPPAPPQKKTGDVGQTMPIRSDRGRMVIEVMQGMINQNLLTLTEHVNAGRIRPGHELKIEARPSGELFCTDLLSEGNRLRERGAIARFYRDARVHAGDRVELVEGNPNRWILQKFPNGQSPHTPVDRRADDRI